MAITETATARRTARNERKAKRKGAADGDVTMRDLGTSFKGTGGGIRKRPQPERKSLTDRVIPMDQVMKGSKEGKKGKGQPKRKHKNQKDKSNTSLHKPSSELREVLEGILNRRYDAEAKLLNLSALGEDEELKRLGMFDTESRKSKLFPVLMKICDDRFKSAQQKKETVHSVSIAKNGLDRVYAVTTLAQTFPDLKNLDLSHNNFKTTKSLEAWRRRFRHLDHLVINDNPLVTGDHNWTEELTKWYSTLRFLNGDRVRSDEEAAAVHKPKPANLPVPILGPSWRDDDSKIGEGFIRQFFVAYDTDRRNLAATFYDETSTFSMSVNQAAVRDPDSASDPHQEWGPYIAESRNLKKITHASTRIKRLFRGTQAISGAMNDLPASRHPPIDEAAKWCLECSQLKSIPDPTGQIVGGVNGLIITAHGEFDELDGSGQVKHRRSFDRTITLGPGGATGIRVVNDLLTIRPYGGNKAWQPTPATVPHAPLPPQVSVLALAPGSQPITSTTETFFLPQPSPRTAALQTSFTSSQATNEFTSAEIAAAIAAQNPDIVPVAEGLIQRLMEATGLNAQYAQDCMTQAGWNLDDAWKLFEQAKPNIPADAYVR